MAPKSLKAPRTPSPPKSPQRTYRLPTPPDPISANKNWAEYCDKIKKIHNLYGPFQLDVRNVIVLPEKPNHITPDIRVTMKEYEEAMKLMEQVDPIKNRDKVPPEKYKLPLTVAQEYGWYSKPLIKRHPLFHFPNTQTELSIYADAYFRSMGRGPFQRKPPIVSEGDKAKGKEARKGGKEGDAKPKTPAKKR